MERFSAHDLQRRIAAVQDAALRAPVAVTHHGRDRLVILSAEAYAQLESRSRQAIAIAEMPDEFLAALEQPYHDDEQEALNHLMGA